MRHSSLLALFGIAALSATGCGDLAEQALESAVERGVEAGADGEDIDLDLDLSNGSAAVQMGDSAGAVGVDLDRPEWLDDNFELPDGLSIMTHSTDSSIGQSVIMGQIQDADIAELTDEQRATAANAGYEIVEGWGNEGSFRGVASNGRVIEVSTRGTGEFSQFTITFYAADSDQAVRAVELADRVEGIGTATATVGDLTLELTGDCTIDGESAQFFSDDGQITASIVNQGSGVRSDLSIADMTDLDNPAVWISTQDGQTMSITDDGFAFSGQFTNMIDGGTAPGTLNVVCA